MNPVGIGAFLTLKLLQNSIGARTPFRGAANPLTLKPNYGTYCFEYLLKCLWLSPL